MTARDHDPFFGKVPERVHLEAAPLVRVLAQVRFPRILKIADEAYIGDFQEAIRREYPNLEPEMVRGIHLDVNDNGISHRVQEAIVWRFLDKEKTHRVSLSQDFITLEAARYGTREDFLARFGALISALQKTICPSNATNIGFRYINRMSGDDALSRLPAVVRPELLNVLQASFLPYVETSMTELSAATLEGRLLVRFGLAPAGFTHDPSTAPAVPERSWVLDVDSTLETDAEFEASALQERLESAAGRAYSFFRWSVQPAFLDQYGRAK